MPSKNLIIVGAGLAGSLLAVFMARQGWRVRVFERRPDPRARGSIGGRSINLALSVRGIDALATVNLADHVMRSDAIAMRGRIMHDPLGRLAFQPYSSNPADAINSVSRSGLNLTLLNAAAREPNVELVFDALCTDCDPDAPSVTFRVPDGSTQTHTADLVASADGAFSAIRGVLMKTDRFDYSQSYLGHAYKELHIPSAPELASAGTSPSPITPDSLAWRNTPASDQLARHHAPDPSLDPARFALDPHALHIWPRGGAMMIALPNRDGSFTCTLFWPFEGDQSFASLQTPEAVDAFFATHYPDARALMPTLTSDYFKNPTSSLVTVRAFPWQRAGKVVLLGDAAHAIVPFYGQGMNASFEDVKALAASLAAHPTDQLSALLEFQALRKPNADAIADMALENFVEMRDKVGQPAFRYRKRVEQAVHRAFPEVVFPQYNLVSFSLVPYAESQRRGRELDALITQVVRQVSPDDAQAMADDAWTPRVLQAFEAARARAPAASGASA